MDFLLFAKPFENTRLCCAKESRKGVKLSKFYWEHSLKRIHYAYSNMVTNLIRCEIQEFSVLLESSGEPSSQAMVRIAQRAIA